MTETASPQTIFEAMGAVVTRWTMGSSASSAASFWRDELGDDPVEAELRLLALSGQFLGATVTAEAPLELRVLPDIPQLALPTVPEPTLRPSGGSPHALPRCVWVRTVARFGRHRTGWCDGSA